MRWLGKKKNKMNSENIKALVEELIQTKVDYKNYDGRMDKADLIFRGNSTILEQIIRKHLLDNHDEKIGVLEAKVKFYEEMISKSNFSAFVETQKPIQGFQKDAE
jgi:23S rRNA maturation mini-RNase III